MVWASFERLRGRYQEGGEKGSEVASEAEGHRLVTLHLQLDGEAMRIRADMEPRSLWHKEGCRPHQAVVVVDRVELGCDHAAWKGCSGIRELGDEEGKWYV